MQDKPVSRFSNGTVAIIVAAILILATVLSYSRFASTTTITITPSATTVTTTAYSTITLPATNQSASIDCNSTVSHDNYVPPTENETAIPYYAGGPEYQCQRVIVVPPGSTGKLVVWYETDLSDWDPPSDGGSDLANLTATVVKPLFSQAGIPPQVEGYTNVTGITVTPSISSVNVTDYDNATSFNVTYTINVSSGVSGYFLLEYLNACPSMIPLAVGYNASQLDEYSFGYYDPFLQGCTMLGMFPGGTLVSVSGIQLAWIIQIYSAPYASVLN
jgi:hypothetical protein